MAKILQGIYEKIVKISFRRSEWRRLHSKNLVIFNLLLHFDVIIE